MANPKTVLPGDAGEPIYTQNGYRFYEEPQGDFLVMDGAGADARPAAAFSLSSGGRPAGVHFLGLYSTQRCPLDSEIKRFAADRVREGYACGK